MKNTWAALTIDVDEPVTLARWWAETLEWEVVEPNPSGTEIQHPDGRAPSLLFMPTNDQRLSKNRLHLDLSPEDQQAAVQDLLARGARRADVGQSNDVPWVVLQDPEGNVFCVLESDQ